ncbi:hypothetical protein AB0L06_30380 [Spirillospora sp. NPDC052269]
MGERTDDCNSWQRTVLLRGAVRTWDEPTDDEPWENPDEWFGRFPIDDEGGADWLWFGRLSVGADELLARSESLPLYFTPATELLRIFLLGLLGNTPCADRLRPLPLDGRRPADVPLAVCDLDSPERPFMEPSYAHEPGVLLLRVVPDDDPELPVPLVPVHEHVWRYLAWGQGVAARPGRSGRWEDDVPHRLSAGLVLSEGAWLRDSRRWWS